MSWCYENAGTADTLIIAGTTLTDLPESKSVTGTAFYQTTRAKCFDLPATYEVWFKFDVYFGGSNRWRAYNGKSGKSDGITATTNGNLEFYANGESKLVYTATGACTANQLQTVLLHMVSDSTAGVIEAWVDGEFIYRYEGNVNQGAAFEDIYLQSDGAGTFFSNVIISDAEIALSEGWRVLYFDAECAVSNEKIPRVWLPFDESPTKDLCGNTWAGRSALTVAPDNAINCRALQCVSGDIWNSGSSPLSMSNLTLGGADFTIRGWFKLNQASNMGGGSRLFYLKGSSDEESIFLTRASDGKSIYLQCLESVTAALSIEFGGQYFYEVDYNHDAGTLRLFLDGTLKAVLINVTIPRTTFAKLHIGYSNWGANTPNGTFDEFQIYDGVALHTEDFAPPTTADYVQLAFELFGESFFCYDADTTRQVFNATTPDYISFTGTSGSYGIIPLDVLAGATTFTIEAKFATTETASQSANYRWKTIIGREVQGNWQDDFGLCVNDGKLCFWAEPKSGGSSSTHNTTSNAIVNDGYIHEVAVVSSEGAIDLYCDGELVAHTDDVNAKITDAYQIAIAGNVNNSYAWLQMSFFEARLWSVARTQEQIFADIDGTEQGLEAWYLPDVTQSAIIPDLSGHERHATLNGSEISQTFDLQADVLATVTNSNFDLCYDGISIVETSELVYVDDYHFNLSGSAFYSATLTLPPMPEVWIEFSVYNYELDSWRVGNDKNVFTGIAGMAPATFDDERATPLELKVFNRGVVINEDISGLTKEVQTIRLHMIADDTFGVIELWIDNEIDGESHFKYTGNVNNGEPFEDLFLQSSGTTCFQSFRISNVALPTTQYLALDFDVVALVTNATQAWSVDEYHVERHWAPPGGTYPPNFIDVIVHDRTAWYQTVVTKAFDLPPTYHLWIDFDVYYDGVHEWRAGNIGSAGFCGASSGLINLYGFSNGAQVFPTADLLQAGGAYSWTPVLIHLLSGTSEGVVKAWFNGKKVFTYTGNVNNGEPFADPVLQSDGAGTYFSNLLFSTNRLDPRGAASFDLYVLHGGEVLSLPFYNYDSVSELALVIHHDDKDWFNILRDLSDPRARVCW